MKGQHNIQGILTIYRWWLIWK